MPIFPMTQDDLKARSKQFALRALKLVDVLSTSRSGKAIGGQLVRSGFSVGSNCRATYRARSRAEFIAKIGVVEEETDESAFWMELILEGGLLPSSKASALLAEANELNAIVASPRKTASRNH